MHTLHLKQAHVNNIAGLRTTFWITILPPIIKTREKDETEDSTVLLMCCGSRDPWCPSLWGLSLRYLFDVKVKECSLYSTGIIADQTVIACDQRSITHFLEMGSGSTVICHFKLIYFWILVWWDISHFHFPLVIYCYQYILYYIICYSALTYTAYAFHNSTGLAKVFNAE